MVAVGGAEPRVDPRVTRTHKLLRDALRSLLAEEGFESISVQDIAERATVNRATFYAHFADKFALLEAIIREEVQAALPPPETMAGADVRTMLRETAYSVFRVVAAHSDCKGERNFESLFQRGAAAVLVQALAKRLDRCSSMLASSAIVAGAMSWRQPSQKELPEATIAEIVDVLADGVKTPAR